MTGPVLILLLAALPVLTGLGLWAVPNRLIKNQHKGYAIAFSSILGRLFYLSFANTGKITCPWFKLGAFDQSFSLVVSDTELTLIGFILSIAMAVHGFGAAYMPKFEKPFKFQLMVAAFTLIMVNLVMAGNLIQLFMAWEGVGVMSWLLIGYYHHASKSGKAALLAFLTNRVADVAFLTGIVMCANFYGTFDLMQDAESAPLIVGSLFLIGAMGKSAQVPFQHWLPAAMAGPTPASALIHAATMVTAGIILLAKTSYIFSSDLVPIMTVIGLATCLVAGWWALRSDDLKGILAYSTLSQLGLMMVGVVLADVKQVYFHLMVHGIAKAGLFLAAGAVIVLIGKRIYELRHDYPELLVLDHPSQDMRLLGGLLISSPLTMVAFLMSALSLMGIPLFAGFLSKEGLLEAIILRLPPSMSYAVVILISAITSAYLSRLLALLFLPGPINFDKLKLPRWSVLTAVPLVLGVSGLFIFHSTSPFSPSLYLLAIKTEHHISAIPLPLVTLAASGLGIAIGLLVARHDKVSWMKLHTLESTAFVAALQHHKSDLNTAWTKVVTHWGQLTAAKLASIFAIADAKGFDGFVNQTAKAIVVIGHGLYIIERYFIDGLVKAFEWSAIRVGKGFSAAGGKQVQTYLAIAVLTILTIVVVWLV